MNAMVSVIITTYCGSKYLSRAIESVINQTYSNIEIIVVDDNGLGTDEQAKTLAITERYRDNVRYIAHEKNRNGAAARNSGIENCLGNFVSFFDDDDVMFPDRIEKCVRILSENKNYDGVFCDVICTDKHMVPTKVVNIRKKGNCSKDILLDGMFLGTGSNMFFTRNAVEKIGKFDERFSRHQDLEYMLRFYREFETLFIPEILIVKSKNDSNNVPVSEKLIANNKLFCDKFKTEINGLGDDGKKIFYENYDSELRYSKLIHAEKGYSMKGLSFRERVIVSICSSGFVNTLFFENLNSIRKKIQSKKIIKGLDSDTIKFINKIGKE